MQQVTYVIFIVMVLAAGALGACGSLGEAEPTPVSLDPTVRLPTLEVKMPLTPDPTPVVTTPTSDPNAMPPTEEDEADPVTVTPPVAEETPEAKEEPEDEELTAPPEEELINQGEEIFAANCAICHQPNGQGTSDYPALDGNEFVTAEDPAPVIETVLYGRGQMPAFQDVLSEQQIAAVISYIRNAWSNDAGIISSEQIQEVQEGGS